MIIYNVTTKVDWSIHEQWLTWMLGTHIPEILATGHFHDYRMMRLLETDEDEGPTYAVQYFTAEMENYHQYVAFHAPVFSTKSIAIWGDKFIAFRTIMETVN